MQKRCALTLPARQTAGCHDRLLPAVLLAGKVRRCRPSILLHARRRRHDATQDDDEEEEHDDKEEESNRGGGGANFCLGKGRNAARVAERRCIQ